MKYLIWRHENALGNSAEQTVGLAKHFKKTGDPYPVIYVENEFQKYFAMCIPGVVIKKLEGGDVGDGYTNLESLLKHIPHDMHIPSVYWNDKMPFKKSPGSWVE